MKKARVQINFKLRPAFYNVLLCLYFEIRPALHVKRARKSTSRGSLGYENFICCLLAGIRKFNLALYKEMTSLGM